MKSSTYRKCPECGTINKDRDYCKNCDALINVLLKRQMERNNREKKKSDSKKLEEPNVVIEFFDNIRNHPNLVIRGLAKILYSIWIVIFAIGAFFAYIIGYIAA